MEQEEPDSLPTGRFRSAFFAALRRTELRLRLQALVDRINERLVPILTIAGVGALSFLFSGKMKLAVLVWGLGVCGIGARALVLGLRGRYSKEALLLLDRSTGAPDDPLLVAHEILVAPPARQEDPYFSLALERIVGRNLPLLPQHAVRSRGLWGLGLFAASLVLLGVGTVRTLSPPVQLSAVPPKEAKASPLLEPETLTALNTEMAALDAHLRSESGRELSRETAALLRELGRGETDREAALVRLLELEANLSEEEDAARRLRRELTERGKALSGAKASRASGQALMEGRLKDAEESLRQLAERLSNPKVPLSKKELSELRAALEKAQKKGEKTSSSDQDPSSKTREALEAKQRSLLSKEKSEGGLSPEETRELKDTRRQLESLDRRKAAAASAAKELSELDKALAEAARALQEEQEKAGGFLERAAESVAQAGARVLSDDEKRQAIEQLKKMREALQADKSGGKTPEQQAFEKRAQGGEGEQGGKQGGSPGGQQGPGSIPIPVPSKGGNPSGAGEGREGSDAAKPGGDGSGKPGGEPNGEPGNGKEPGNAHDPDSLLGDSSRPTNSAENTSASARETGQGESASETIRTAAERGFTRRGYRDLYREYETEAEEVLRGDEIPAGRRAPVMNYFELIRPRKVGGKAEAP